MPYLPQGSVVEGSHTPQIRWTEVHFLFNCGWQLGEFSTIEAALPLTMAFVSIASAQTLSRSVNHTSDLISLCSEPPPGLLGLQVHLPHGLAVPTPCLPTGLARTALQIHPWSYFLYGRLGVSNALQTRAPLPSHRTGSAIPSPFGRSDVETVASTESKCMNTEENRRRKGNNWPSSLMSPSLSAMTVQGVPGVGTHALCVIGSINP